MPEAPDLLARLRAAAAAREAAGLGRALRPRQAGPDPLTDLASNDYLGLARHPQVIEGAVDAAGLAVAAQRIFADHGVRAGCFRPPSVPRAESCLRLTARAGLTEADFTAATRALAAVRDHVVTAGPVGRK